MQRLQNLLHGVERITVEQHRAEHGSFSIQIARRHAAWRRLEARRFGRGARKTLGKRHGDSSTSLRFGVIVRKRPRTDNVSASILKHSRGFPLLKPEVIHRGPNARRPGRSKPAGALHEPRAVHSQGSPLLSLRSAPACQRITSFTRRAHHSLLDRRSRERRATYFLTTSTLRLIDTVLWSLTGTSNVPSVLIGSGKWMFLRSKVKPLFSNASAMSLLVTEPYILPSSPKERAIFTLEPSSFLPSSCAAAISWLLRAAAAFFSSSTRARLLVVAGTASPRGNK